MVAREYWEKSNDNDLSNYNDDLLNKTLQKLIIQKVYLVHR